MVDRPNVLRRTAGRRGPKPWTANRRHADDAELEMPRPRGAWQPRHGRNSRAAGLSAVHNALRRDRFGEELCEPEELDRLRGYLDKQLSHLQGVVSRLANRLQRRLMAQQNRAWEFDLEEGLLDPVRLTRIIIDPMHALSFKREKDTQFRDTVVTLLLDNSGSMRGRPITLSATFADILARTLERWASSRDPAAPRAVEGRAVRRGCLAPASRDILSPHDLRHLSTIGGRALAACTQEPASLSSRAFSREHRRLALDWLTSPCSHSRSRRILMMTPTAPLRRLYALFNAGNIELHLARSSTRSIRARPSN